MLFFVFAAYSLLSVPLCVRVEVFLSGLTGPGMLQLDAAGVCIRLELGGGRGKKRRRIRLRTVLGVLRGAVRIETIDLSLRVGTGDALSTALAAGGAQAGVLSVLGALGAPSDTHVRVMPDFAACAAAVRARCIFSVSPGDIMLSAARAAIKKRRKEGMRWSSIPSRA